MKTKILTALLLLTILLSGTTFTSCGSDGKADAADVHVFYYTYSDPYISGVRAAVGSELTKAGIT